MNPDTPEIISIEKTAEAVDWWLQLEAGNSTFDRNSPLDNLEDGRNAMLARNNPKVEGHIGRMELWLQEYGVQDLRPDQAAELTGKVAFGALMFMSGTFRRLRYLQSADQADYFRRKLEWLHPGGVNVPDYLGKKLRKDSVREIEAIQVRGLGGAALEISKNSRDTTYDRAPLDFERITSESVSVINREQIGWLSFLSKALTHASQTTGLALENVPILEPKSITDAKPITLAEVLATKNSGSTADS